MHTSVDSAVNSAVAVPAKKHPRETPAPSMEACKLLDALEDKIKHLELVTDGSTRLHVEWATLSFARWLDKEDADFPTHRSAAIGTLNNCLKHSVHTVIRLLEMGVPVEVALSFLPHELMGSLKKEITSPPYVGGTD